jgi:hypothetical protein
MASGAETFTKVVAPSLGLILSNTMFLAPLSVRAAAARAARLAPCACRGFLGSCLRTAGAAPVSTPGRSAQPCGQQPPRGACAQYRA